MATALQKPICWDKWIVVVVHRAHGLRFVIYVDDHEPAHVHVYGPGRAKVQLSGTGGLPQLLEARDMKSHDLRRMMAEVNEHQTGFQNEWDRISGRRA